MCGTIFLLLQANGTWYVFFHSSNDIENKLDCVVVNFGNPKGNISLITLQAYGKRWV